MKLQRSESNLEVWNQFLNVNKTRAATKDQTRPNIVHDSSGQLASFDVQPKLLTTEKGDARKTI